MILRILLCLSLLSFHLLGQSNKLSLQGFYQGENLMISNPTQQDGFGFCTYKATVNGEILPATTQKNIFEIDFQLFKLNIGDPVFVVLEHAEGCSPKFLNPESLKPKSTFVCNSIKLEPDGLLNWNTTEEGGKLDFVIEQYRWKKWVEVGKVVGIGSKGPNEYKFILNLHSGDNKIRVAQYDNTGKGRYSKEVSVFSSIEEIFKNGTKITDKIYFFNSSGNTRTRYEIHDAYGNLLKLGSGKYVDCSNLVSGLYYLSFDNKTEKFFKVKP